MLKSCVMHLKHFSLCCSVIFENITIKCYSIKIEKKGCFLVEDIKNKNEVNAILWIVVGPTFLILTSLLSWVQGEAHLAYLTLASLISLPLCFFWRMRGLIASIALIPEYGLSFPLH